MGVGLTHTKKLLIKNKNGQRRQGNWNLRENTLKNLAFGLVFGSDFDLQNLYSKKIVVTDSDYRLTECMCAIVITDDVSFKAALAADFKKE